MMKKPPRIKIPEAINAGEVIEIKTLATHIMETGNRKDPVRQDRAARHHPYLHGELRGPGGVLRNARLGHRRQSIHRVLHARTGARHA